VLVVAGPILYMPGTMHPFSSPKLAALGLAIGLFALSLWSERSTPLSRPTLWLLAGLLLFGSLSFLRTESVSLSFWGVEDFEMGGFVMLLGLAAFLLGAYSYPLLDTQPWIRNALVLPAILLGAAIVPWLLGLLPDYFQGTRLSLSLGNPIHLGAYAAAILVFSVAVLPVASPRSRVFLAVAALSSVGLLMASQSRGGLLGAGVALLLLLGSSGKLRPSAKRIRLLKVVALVGAAGVVFTLLWLTVPRIIDFDLGGESVRLSLLSTAVGALPDSLVTGSGPATFKLHHLAQLTPSEVTFLYKVSKPVPSHAHNWLLEYSVTYGVPFALLFTLLLTLPGRHLRSSTRMQRGAYCGSIAIATAGLFNPMSIPTLTLLLLLLGYSSVRQHSSAPLTATTPTRPRRRAVQHVALTAVGILILSQSAIFLYVDERAKTYSVQGNGQKLERVASLLVPGRPSLFTAAGQAFAFDGRFRRRPDLAERVDEVFAKAVSLDSKDVTTLMSWGVALQILDRHREAISKFESALELVPGWPVAERSMAYSYSELGDREQAAAILRGTLMRHPYDRPTWQLFRLVSYEQPALLGIRG